LGSLGINVDADKGFDIGKATVSLAHCSVLVIIRQLERQSKVSEVKEYSQQWLLV
jgi:hypothetical protein